MSNTKDSLNVGNTNVSNDTKVQDLIKHYESKLSELKREYDRNATCKACFRHDLPPGLEDFTAKRNLPTVKGLPTAVSSTTQAFYNAWNTVSGPRAETEPLLHGLSAKTIRQYKLIPEEFYTATNLPIISPANYRESVEKTKKHGKIQFQEIPIDPGRSMGRAK